MQMSGQRRREHRPRRRAVPGLLEGQQGGPCVWSRVSEGERGRRGGQGGDRAGHAGPCGPRGGLGLLPQGGGTLEGCGQGAGRGRGLTQVLTHALWWLLLGGQTPGEERVGAREIRVQVSCDGAGPGSGRNKEK